jgi:hypothetical protein
MHHTELCDLTMAQEVAAARVKACEDIIDYTFEDKEKIWEALQITGTRGQVRGNEGNKRVALVGDRVLNLILVEEWHASGERRGRIS